MRKGRRTVNMDVGLAFMPVLTLLEREVGRSFLGLGFKERSSCCSDGEETVDYEVLEGNHCECAKLLMWCLDVMECDLFDEERGAEKGGWERLFLYLFSHYSTSSFQHQHHHQVGYHDRQFPKSVNSLTTRS